jgi:hypothetical protein
MYTYIGKKHLPDEHGSPITVVVVATSRKDENDELAIQPIAI